MRKRTCNNPKLDLVIMNAYIKFGENLLICSQDIERKRNNDERTDEWNDRQPKFYIVPPPFSKWGYNYKGWT